jgi:transposase
MVSNYSTRVNKISGPSENNEASTSSSRSTVTALDQELLINEKTVEQAISLISTIKSQHQLQINSESTSASTITLTKETASDSSEKLNDYVIVSKEEAAEAPNEPATSEPLNPSEEEDKEINLIADAIQAITNEMKSALVAETRVGRETVETIVHEESISEKKTYTSNMQSVLERIKETLDETQKFLDESEKQTVMLPEEPSPVFRAELNKENEIIGNCVLKFK